jgi:hypothetical protein
MKSKPIAIIAAFALAAIGGASAVLTVESPKATVAPALIGFGCGPEKATMYAEEEDHFPACDAIESIDGLLYALEGDLDK